MDDEARGVPTSLKLRGRNIKKDLTFDVLVVKFQVKQVNFSKNWVCSSASPDLKL